jgi:hypothetical protein
MGREPALRGGPRRSKVGEGERKLGRGRVANIILEMKWAPLFITRLPPKRLFRWSQMLEPALNFGQLGEEFGMVSRHEVVCQLRGLHRGAQAYSSPSTRWVLVNSISIGSTRIIGNGIQCWTL